MSRPLHEASQWSYPCRINVRRATFCVVAGSDLREFATLRAVNVVHRFLWKLLVLYGIEDEIYSVNVTLQGSVDPASGRKSEP